MDLLLLAGRRRHHHRPERHAHLHLGRGVDHRGLPEPGVQPGGGRGGGSNMASWRRSSGRFWAEIRVPADPTEPVLEKADCGAAAEVKKNHHCFEISFSDTVFTLLVWNHHNHHTFEISPQIRCSPSHWYGRSIQFISRQGNFFHAFDSSSSDNISMFLLQLYFTSQHFKHLFL